ncbi:DNA recombination protein RmuC [Corynebacterium choanae]|uniref:DNA recombination protein RmuC n=1 Tax=Corynebacterium choanae TaxID=1862358 RepID=A0A3G6JB08_9CORY|nr:DNA recombination protein RmuC [Corynebacterium choanae]AZA13184.1 DNA recombination protein RmuC [Corynebacterium choanae]
MGSQVVLALAMLAIGVAIGLLIGVRVQLTRSSTDSQRQQDEAAMLAATMRADRAELARDQQHTITQAVGVSVAPLQQALRELGKQVRALEVEHAQSSTQLVHQVHHVGELSTRLGDATLRLASALSNPTVRGRWGEMQLQRVVELAGMQQHCDFDTQVHRSEDGISHRPDMVIRLAGDRTIVVDAKVPLRAWQEAQDATDEAEQRALLVRHANHVRGHIQALKNKNYPKYFQPAPDFTIMFVPADPFLDAAFRVDPDLMEYAFGNNIVLATPTTLLALLRTVSLGWRQEAVSQRARKVEQLGAQLYHRLGVVSDHVNKLGQQLTKTVETFNATTASLDSRLTVTARSLAELQVVESNTATDAPLATISQPVRLMQTAHAQQVPPAHPTQSSASTPSTPSGASTPPTPAQPPTRQPSPAGLSGDMFASDPKPGLAHRTSATTQSPHTTSNDHHQHHGSAGADEQHGTAPLTVVPNPPNSDRDRRFDDTADPQEVLLQQGPKLPHTADSPLPSATDPQHSSRYADETGHAREDTGNTPPQVAEGQLPDGQVG